MPVEVSWLPRTTAVGRRATALGLGLLLAGLTTGNNLFHLVFAVLAAAELVSFVVARHVLRRTRAEVSLAPRGSAGEPLRCRVELTNGSRWLPLPGMAWEVTTSRGERAAVTTPPVAPRSRGAGAGRIVPGGRGRLGVELLAARTDFPLGLVATRCRAAGHAASALVHPHAEPGDEARRAGRAARDAPAGRPSGRGDEPLEARAYRPGDDARGIDWKATARRGEPILRERRGLPPDALEVWLDRSGAEGAAFEERVRRAAGAALEGLRQGAAVGLAAGPSSVPPAAGEAQARRILDALAVVGASGEEPA